ncbi:hypothetical protein [Blastococcus xanthinilyticus]|uniref:Uncharacterized protein n=1 Tax=Blastococcus xanthinilyticus TaxID=1564164 RepID=A0A5S5CZ62_9ACTN|nr:hypothetical protein [Blastococcus xanthinilyticus]TYP89033.1 hypothetical protein BD833_103189 [Blastococcus xanthinilyticus]
MSGETQWFGGQPGRNEAETAYLARLREEVGGWTLDGLSPGHTWAADIGLPLYIDIDVPGLSELRRPLQVGFWTGGPSAGRSGGYVLQGVWGDDHPLDDHDGNSPECLTVIGVDATPEQHATWAAEWLLRQLRRPVVREDWLRDGRVVAATWRLSDTGTVLARQGSSPRRLLRRAPDRVTEVR